MAAAVYALWLFLLGREGGLGGRLLRDSLALGGAFLLLVTYSPAAALLARPLLVRPEVGPADLIVVLGSGLNPDASLTTESLERTLYAVHLYRRRLAPRISSGGASDGASSIHALKSMTETGPSGCEALRSAARRAPGASVFVPRSVAAFAGRTPGIPVLLRTIENKHLTRQDLERLTEYVNRELGKLDR